MPAAVVVRQRRVRVPAARMRRAAQRALDALGHRGKCGFAVKCCENGAADEGRAAKTCENGAAEPLHGYAAAVDKGRIGAVDGKRRLMAKINRSGCRAPVIAPAVRPVAQTAIP